MEPTWLAGNHAEVLEVTEQHFMIFQYGLTSICFYSLLYYIEWAKKKPTPILSQLSYFNVKLQVKFKMHSEAKIISDKST